MYDLVDTGRVDPGALDGGLDGAAPSLGARERGEAPEEAADRRCERH
jgi:hypothetical protein